MGERCRHWCTAVALVVGLLAAACSGGGGDDGPQDLGLVQGETDVQFEAADKVRLGGTLAMPEPRSGGPVGAVLIVPSTARSDRNGYIDVVPGDAVYQDLSKAITAAGLAAFRYDRRSMGASKIEPGQQFSLEDTVTDAHEALLYLSQRSGIDGNNLAIVGHDLGGIAAMKVAATDDKVKGVVLLSTPGRPLVDVMAGGFEATSGRESSEAFRGVIATLRSTGSLPEHSTIRPEHQTVLPTGNDGLLRDQFAVDPVAEAAKVTVPTLVVTGRRSPLVGPADGDRLQAALPSGQVLIADTTATLQKVAAPLSQAPDPNAPETATRDQAAVDQITSFLASTTAAPRS